MVCANEQSTTKPYSKIKYIYIWLKTLDYSKLSGALSSTKKAFLNIKKNVITEVSVLYLSHCQARRL